MLNKHFLKVKDYSRKPSQCAGDDISLCFLLIGGIPSSLCCQMDVTEESCLDLFLPESVVYLTPDAEEGLKNSNG